MQERILVRQVARDLTAEDIDAVNGGFHFPFPIRFPFPIGGGGGGGGGGGSTNTQTISQFNINGVVTTDNSRDS